MLQEIEEMATELPGATLAAAAIFLLLLLLTDDPTCETSKKNKSHPHKVRLVDSGARPHALGNSIAALQSPTAAAPPLLPISQLPPVSVEASMDDGGAPDGRDE